jgi:hypothetical protein
MRVINQPYKFTPPNGDPAEHILILGWQDYAPGQSRQCDSWQLKVPQIYAERLEDQTECDSYGEVHRLLADVFFAGDVAQVANFI